MDAYRAEEADPGPGVTEDADILDHIRRTANTAFHPVGTCRMAPGPQGVVDDRLRVHGLQGLRIADASIMRSEEHTSELQSLMRISYAVFCLKKKTTRKK